MAFRVVYIHIGICMLFLPTTLAGLLNQDTNNDANSPEADSEARHLSSLLQAERRKLIAPEAAEMEQRNEKETVEKIDAAKTKIDITKGNELIERHIQDCEKRYEIIVMNNSERHKRPKTCYLRYMDNTLYASECLGRADTPKEAFTIADQIVDKDFLSEDGPDSVCRHIPMYNTKVVEQEETSTKRGLNVSKKCVSCAFECKGWWNCPFVCRPC
ncbi:hypothetical protein CHS0354_024318 [Potamilus streckersoni]|uniref:Uncharacterized protein n=1 Tax=Potamilus streckersoni TaxID=2493646 RepID=A0AAE0VFZ6_9BIVA|nr:hypothetical protein CHS0354_024318 [Potamilus streckersoni]